MTDQVRARREEERQRDTGNGYKEKGAKERIAWTRDAMDNIRVFSCRCICTYVFTGRFPGGVSSPDDDLGLFIDAILIKYWHRCVLEYSYSVGTTVRLLQKVQLNNVDSRPTQYCTSTGLRYSTFDKYNKGIRRRILGIC